MGIYEELARLYARATATTLRMDALAVALAGEGIKIFPVSPGGEGMPKPAKQPLVTHGYLDATADMAQVQAWWRRWPTAMVGLACEPNGLFVIDVDRPKRDGEADGMDTLAKWAEAHGALNTLTVTTPTGGLHLYFRYADDGGPAPRQTAKDQPGIDTRWNGYVIAAGSCRADGGRYDMDLKGGTEIAPISAWLLEMYRGKPTPDAIPAMPTLPTSPVVAPLPTAPTPVIRAAQGDRNAADELLARGWTKFAADSMAEAVQEMAAAVDGGRNDVLAKVCHRIGHLLGGEQLPRQDAQAALDSIRRAWPGDPMDAHDEKTAIDCLREGTKEPYWATVDAVTARNAAAMAYQNRPKIEQNAPKPDGKEWRGLVDVVQRVQMCARQLRPVGEEKPIRWMQVPLDGGGYALIDGRPDADMPAGRARELPQIVRGRNGADTFNAAALWQQRRPVFVVMDVLDALSIVECGGEAMALVNADNAQALAKRLRRRHPQQPVLLDLGAGKGAQDCADTIQKTLEDAQVPVFRMCLVDGDTINGELNAPAGRLREMVDGLRSLDDVRRYAHEKEERSYDSGSGYARAMGLLDRNEARRQRGYIPTGFPRLDALLNGGLSSGLYVAGALSGLGKTTFALQIADHVAAAGQDVLFFSLEMSADELMNRSLSRITYQEGEDWAMTTAGVMAAGNGGILDDARREVLHRAWAQYTNNVSRHIYFRESSGIGWKEIRAAAEKHTRVKGRAPLVIVDYLQILAPADPRATDKQNTDKNMTELKGLSRDLDTPVLVISSFNRSSYREDVSQTAFKESGAIEYSSDVLLGIQYAMKKDGKEGKDVDAMEAARIRSAKGQDHAVIVKVLKHRNGKQGEVLFRLSNKYNTYAEDPQQPQADVKDPREGLKALPIDYTSGKGKHR